MVSLKKGIAIFAVLAAIICINIPSVRACGANSVCQIGERHYMIRMPEDYDGKTLVGAIIYAHGYTGTARGVMRNKGLEKLAQSLGIALIAAKSAGRDWTIPGAPNQSTVPGVDELAYFDNLIDDATKRFPIDKNKLLAAGFSAGGMMVWNLACHRAHRFVGFVPIAGTFWRPIPKRCTTLPTNIIHIHGTLDKVVPLAGRRIANTWQGDVFSAITMYIRHGKFGPMTKLTDGKLSCQRRVNQTQHLLEFCTFPGGHAFDPNYIARAWRLIVLGQQS